MINNSSDKKAYLFGSPVAHSISPRMHNLSFKERDIDANYSAIDISCETIENVTDYIRSDDFLGANVTMPLKTDIIKYIDKLDITSRLSGAVNTIVPVNGQLIGYTTDGAGFIDSLQEINVDIKNHKILILGAGGAARAIIVQAAIDGALSITIAKRWSNNIESVIKFADNVSSETDCNVDVIDINNQSLLQKAIEDNTIIINATPVGMTDNNSLINKSLLRPSLIVCDLIYEPDMTPLLQDAKEVGCKYINGKYMLLYQGARSFKLWTGVDMPIKKVKDMYFA